MLGFLAPGKIPFDDFDASVLVRTCGATWKNSSLILRFPAQRDPYYHFAAYGTITKLCNFRRLFILNSLLKYNYLSENMFVLLQVLA